MIWIIAIGILFYILYKFAFELKKDNYDLKNQNLNEKFSVIVSTINNDAFDGNGSITILDKRNFNLYQNGKNQIIYFQFGTGHLTIIWKYKYFQKEVVHEKIFYDVRNLSIFEQEKIANQMIYEKNIIIQKHMEKVISDAL